MNGTLNIIADKMTSLLQEARNMRKELIAKWGDNCPEDRKYLGMELGILDCIKVVEDALDDLERKE